MKHKLWASQMYTNSAWTKLHKKSYESWIKMWLSPLKLIEDAWLHCEDILPVLCRCCWCCHSQMCCNECFTHSYGVVTSVHTQPSETDTGLLTVALWFLSKSIIVHNVCILKPENMLYIETCIFKALTIWLSHHRPQVGPNALMCLLTIGQRSWHKFKLCSLFYCHMAYCQYQSPYNHSRDNW